MDDNWDPITITLSREGAVSKLEELTGASFEGFTVVKDGLKFETTEHGSVWVSVNLVGIISATTMAHIIQAAGLVPERLDADRG